MIHNIKLLLSPTPFFFYVSLSPLLLAPLSPSYPSPSQYFFYLVSLFSSISSLSPCSNPLLPPTSTPREDCVSLCCVCVQHLSRCCRNLIFLKAKPNHTELNQTIPSSLSFGPATLHQGSEGWITSQKRK